MKGFSIWNELKPFRQLIPYFVLIFVGTSNISLLLPAPANSNQITLGANDGLPSAGSISTLPPDFNFAAAGDWGCGGKAKRTLDYMLARQPELVLALGDLSYNRTLDCWLHLVAPLKAKLKIAIGYHDLDQYANFSRADQYLEAFNLSEPFYSFNYNNVHFVALATEIPYNVTTHQYANSDQYKFVESDLKRASMDDRIKWIVAFGYRPLYSSPSFHNASGILRDIYHPLFDKYGVDLVLQAHNHNYQRTYPLSYNPDTRSAPLITDKNATNFHHKSGGPIFITVGTAGKDLYNFTGRAPYIVTQFDRNGFLNIDITNNGTNLTGTFIENRNGGVEDHFTIIKD